MPGYNLEFNWNNGYTLSFNIHEEFYNYVVKPELDKGNIESKEGDEYVYGLVVRVIWKRCREAGYTIGSRDFGDPECFYVWELGDTRTFFV